MTEAKQPKYEIIPRDFNGKEIDFISKEDDVWITAETVGIGLEYNSPRKSIMNLYSAHRDEIEIYSSVIDLMTEAGMRKTTVFNEMGAYLLIMFSNQPKAKEFRKWVVNVIKEIRKTGIYIENPTKLGSTDWALQTLEVMRSVVLTQQEQERKQIEQEKRLKELEEKDRYIFVIPRTKRKLRDEVDRIAREYFNGLHWKVWNPLKTHYQVSRYEEFTEEEAQNILKGFGREYPPKMRGFNQK